MIQAKIKMRLKNKILILLLVGLACPLLVLAQSSTAAITINPNLPGPQSATAGPCGWIVNFYNFALIIGGILAFGAIVYGGFKYATSAGNASSQSEGRSWIQSALIGLLLLGGVYVILHTIYPGLTTCSLPSLSALPASTAATSTPSANSSSTSTGANSKCQAPASGPCVVGALQGTCMGSNAQTAAGVCNVESSGNSSAQGDICDDHAHYASIGLFQINISANTISDPSTGQTLNCPSAFSHPYTGSNPHCTVTNQQLYTQCITAVLNPSANIAKACSLSSNGTNWNLWGPATKQACGL